MLTSIISFGVILAFVLVIFCTIKWWNLTLTGTVPQPLYVFIAILFTSGLDVGLIMFPLGLPDLGVLLPDHLLFLCNRTADKIL